MTLPELSERTLLRAYRRALEATPDAIAHIDPDGEWTFEQSFTRSSRLAGGLAHLGVGRRHPVGLLLDNSVDNVHLWMGVALSGAIEVPISTAYKHRFLTHVLNDSGCELLVAEADLVERLLPIAKDLTRLRTVVVRGDLDAAAALRDRFAVVPWAELEAHGEADPVDVDPAELLAIMYTSGTTGASKGVMCSHAHAYTYASQQDDPNHRPRQGDRVLLTLPMFHIGGQWAWVYRSLIHRSTCILERGFSVSNFWDVVRRRNITVTGLLGSMSELLWRQPPRPDDADNPLEIAILAPAPSDLDGFLERFGVQAMTGYGMSEIGQVTSGPVGSVIGNEGGFRRGIYQLRLVGDDGQDVADGLGGELWVKPDEPLTVTSGYLGLPEATAALIDPEGWLHTGDVLRRDESGRYYFLDRVKDALRRRGENVSSFEVESVINAHPDIVESAVVAVHSELTEDEIRAVVVLREGAVFDPIGITGYLVERLPYFMVPRYLETAAELPKTPSQKVRKAQLRDAGLAADTWDREAAGIKLGSGRTRVRGGHV
ncbi:AMP-binding protein [Nakamurella lactea]|uniref:AMP-binding protein n=1 Tax=Nakamurella lactea TaxID=459515 RepID=UPI0004167F3F|nr:AMP-binding protein [Nakamurella lactea]